jgi:hypothetical protein
LKSLKKISLILLLLPSVLWASMAIQNTPILGGIAVIDFESNHHNPCFLTSKSKVCVEKPCTVMDFFPSFSSNGMPINACQ